jgi:hypothetical protein
MATYQPEEDVQFTSVSGSIGNLPEELRPSNPPADEFVPGGA